MALPGGPWPRKNDAAETPRRCKAPNPAAATPTAPGALGRAAAPSSQHQAYRGRVQPLPVSPAALQLHAASGGWAASGYCTRCQEQRRERTWKELYESSGLSCCVRELYLSSKPWK